MPVPTITLVSPNAGSTGGRRLVKITGTNFQLPPAPATTGVVAKPGPSVEVLFGTKKSRDVRVLSTGLLHVLSPVSDPGLVGITVRNITQSGTVIPGETVTLANAFTYSRPNLNRNPSEELTLQRVLRYLIIDLSRQIINNVELTVHTDYDDTPDGANVAMLATIPGLVLIGPRLRENRAYSLNQARKVTQPDGSALLLRPPRTVDLVFTLIGVDDLTLPTIALLHETEMYFQRNTLFEMPRSEAAPTGEQVDYEMAIEPDGEFSWTGAPGNSNIRAFSGTFSIRGVDLDDEDMAAMQAYPVTDLVRAGTAGPTVDTPSPAILVGKTGPAGVTMAPGSVVSGPGSASPGQPDMIEQLPLDEE